jgi:hypothetical protein
VALCNVTSLRNSIVADLISEDEVIRMIQSNMTGIFIKRESGHRHMHTGRMLHDK